jgi:hypothetical protein
MTDDGNDLTSAGMTSRSTPPLSEGLGFRAVGEGGITTPIHEPCIEFDEYLHRSHRRPLGPEPSIWSSWTWDQLRAPVYDATSTLSNNGGLDYNANQDVGLPWKLSPVRDEDQESI